jgi:hypothetical protein
MKKPEEVPAGRTKTLTISKKKENLISTQDMEIQIQVVLLIK